MLCRPQVARCPDITPAHNPPGQNPTGLRNETSGTLNPTHLLTHPEPHFCGEADGKPLGHSSIPCVRVVMIVSPFASLVWDLQDYVHGI